MRTLADRKTGPEQQLWPLFPAVGAGYKGQEEERELVPSRLLPLTATAGLCYDATAAVLLCCLLLLGAAC